MVDEAIALLHSHDWHLYMLWEDGRGWGATVRDTLEGTCEHHATARGVTASDAIHSAMLRLADEAYDESETVVAVAEPKSTIAERANSILSAIGIGRKAGTFKLLGGKPK